MTPPPVPPDDGGDEHQGANRILCWNAKVNRPVGEVLDGLASLIDSTNPKVVCLQEFKNYIKKARDRFSDDWFVYAHADWSESNDNPMLVRRDGHDQQTRGEKNGWDTLRTRKDWTGPHGNIHHGRTWTWVKVSGMWVLSLHRVTGGDGKNKAAFGEEFDVLTTWITNHSPCLVIGDHNCGPNATFPHASKLIASEVGGSISHDGGIDYGIQRGVKGTVATKGKHGSDHPAILWTL